VLAVCWSRYGDYLAQPRFLQYLIVQVADAPLVRPDLTVLVHSVQTTTRVPAGAGASRSVTGSPSTRRRPAVRCCSIRRRDRPAAVSRSRTVVGAGCSSVTSSSCSRAPTVRGWSPRLVTVNAEVSQSRIRCPTRCRRRTASRRRRRRWWTALRCECCLSVDADPLGDERDDFLDVRVRVLATGDCVVRRQLVVRVPITRSSSKETESRRCPMS
jgi:hypothetical protein